MQENVSLVSIIIPVYNGASLILETIESIVAQTYTNWECIVVDDGSIDDTKQVVQGICKSDLRFRLLERPNTKIKGANSCRNIGIEKAKGAFLMFLDSDDLLVKTCVENRINILNKNDHLDFVIANTSYLKNNKLQTQPICEFPEDTSTKTYLDYFLKNNLPWTIMSVLWKKETIGEIRFDENLMRFQDDDFHTRVLMQKQLQCFRINKIDTYYRVEDESVKLSKTYVNIALVDYLKLLHKHDVLFQNNSYKKSLRVFNCKIILEFILPYFYSNKVNSNKILKFNITSKQYGFNQKLYLVLLMFFLNTKLFKQSGIGMNSFRKQLKKVILN